MTQAMCCAWLTRHVPKHRVPDFRPQSAVNIGGGFTITQRMLDMFKRPGDPEEHMQVGTPQCITVVLCVHHYRWCNP